MREARMVCHAVMGWRHSRLFHTSVAPGVVKPRAGMDGAGSASRCVVHKWLFNTLTDKAERAFAVDPACQAHGFLQSRIN